jgi:NAD(P)-dependent dehydrogenase (short-subunit alcohol dehydrogenase family)
MLACAVVQSVLITGASTGIGRACTLHMDRQGWRVFAGVRKEEDAASLREAGSERMSPLILDVTDAGQIAAAAARIGEEVGEAGLDGLVNNAGIAVTGPLEALPIDDFRRQVEVNLTAHVAVTQAMLPAIRTARGRVVFITSIGGLMAFPMFGAYHAAKFGLEAVGDVFRQELRPWGISVSVVEPGSIDTPIWERGQQEADALLTRIPADQGELYSKSIAAFRKVAEQTAARGISPEKVARAIEHALSARRPRTRYLVGLDAKVQARLRHVIPTRLLDRLVARATKM